MLRVRREKKSLGNKDEKKLLREERRVEELREQGFRAVAYSKKREEG